MAEPKKAAGSDGQEILRVRTEILKMTQEKLADAAGISVSTLRGWETGRQSVPKYFMALLDLMERHPGSVPGADPDSRGPGGPRAWIEAEVAVGRDADSACLAKGIRAFRRFSEAVQDAGIADGRKPSAAELAIFCALLDIGSEIRGIG